MSALTDFPRLTAGARRAALCELADLYTVEQRSHDRPLTEALPAILPGLHGHNVGLVEAINLFAQFAAQRAFLGSADAGYDAIATAELRAERLLDQLVGEVPA